MDVVIEDDSPVFYLDLMNDQPLFVGFHIMEPVRIDGFWVMLNTGSRGWTEYAVYRSQDGLLPPIPDLVAPPVVPISQTYMDDVTEMKWVWFDKSFLISSFFNMSAIF